MIQGNYECLIQPKGMDKRPSWGQRSCAGDFEHSVQTTSKNDTNTRVSKKLGK
jgi:hypothetical protein